MLRGKIQSSHGFSIFAVERQIWSIFDFMECLLLNLTENPNGICDISTISEINWTELSKSVYLLFPVCSAATIYFTIPVFQHIYVTAWMSFHTCIDNIKEKGFYSQIPCLFPSHQVPSRFISSSFALPRPQSWLDESTSPL